MLTGNHFETARDFLDASDRKFAGGDRLQGSEKLWGAASYVVMAVDQECNWQYRTHRLLKNAVQMLTDETGDYTLHAGFPAAEKFHKNIYHDEMEGFEIDIDRPIVHLFVARMLGFLEAPAQ